MSMSRSVAENVRTFRLLTCHAPRGAIYKNYTKLVWFLIIRHVSQMSRFLLASVQMLLRAEAGETYGSEAGECCRAGLTLRQNFNIGLLPQGVEPLLGLPFGFVA